MGIFTRVRDIFSSNINSMLDKAEDPEKMIKLMITEMEDTLVEIKASCAGAMAALKKVERAFDAARSRADSWSSKAELAVSRNRDDLAREALLEKRRYIDKARALEKESDEAQAVISQYQDQISQLEQKLDSAREKKRLLVQRQVHALNKSKVSHEIRRLDTSDAFTRFEQFENRIDRLEAESELTGLSRKHSLEEEFDLLEKDDDLERELLELKEKSQKNQ